MSDMMVDVANNSDDVMDDHDDLGVQRRRGSGTGGSLHPEDPRGGQGGYYSLGLPSQTHKSTGKGRFAHRKHQKSKSLCTLETNLDEVGEPGTGEDLRRVPSVHELRVTKSLQKLNVPDWFKQSSLSKSSSCLLKYGSNSTMNSFSFSPSLISSPCASTAPPAPNVVIKTRVVPPSNPRILRSPNFASSSSQAGRSLTSPRHGGSSTSSAVKLPSDKLREREKNKNLMPIPIVPFAQIRAMFEKKGVSSSTRGEKGGGGDLRVDPLPPPKPAREETRAASRAAGTTVPSISISGSEEETARHQLSASPSSPSSSAAGAGVSSTKRTTTTPPPVFDSHPPFSSPTRRAPLEVVEEAVSVTATSPVSGAAPVSHSHHPPHPPHYDVPGVNGVSGGDMVMPHSSMSTTRTDNFPPPPPSSSSTITAYSPPGRSSGADTITDKPPISPTRDKEPKSSWRIGGADTKDSPKKTSTSTSPSKGEPKSPSKDSKQQFSPTRSLRQFFGRSKDKSSGSSSGSDKGGKSDGEGGAGGGGEGGTAQGSLDSSFSSGDGYYEKEPRRIGVSEKSRRFQPSAHPPHPHPAPDPTTTSNLPSSAFDAHKRDSRSDPDTSFSSLEGQHRSSAWDPSLPPSSSSYRGGVGSRQPPQSGATGFPSTGGVVGGGVGGVGGGSFSSSSSSTTMTTRGGGVGFSNVERHRPPFSRYGPPPDDDDDDDRAGDVREGSSTSASATSGPSPRSSALVGESPSRFQRGPVGGTAAHLGGGGFGHVSLSSENGGDLVPEHTAGSDVTSTPTGAVSSSSSMADSQAEKKSVKETTV